MSFTRARNWHVNTYTPNTATDFVVDEGASGSVVHSIVLSMVPHSSPLVTTASLRLFVTDDSDVELFTLLPATPLDAADGPQVLDVRSITLLGGQKIRFEAAEGVELFASGADDFVEL